MKKLLLLVGALVFRLLTVRDRGRAFIARSNLLVDWGQLVGDAGGVSAHEKTRRRIGYQLQFD